MNGQKVRVGKGRVHSRVKAKSLGSEKAKQLIRTYVTDPQEERRKISEEWCALSQAGVPYAAIAEEYNTSAASVYLAVHDPKEWARRGIRNGYMAGLKASKTRHRRRSASGPLSHKRLAGRRTKR